MSAIPSARFPYDRRSEVGGKLGEAAGCRGVVDVDKCIYMSTVHARSARFQSLLATRPRVRNCFYNISHGGDNGDVQAGIDAPQFFPQARWCNYVRARKARGGVKRFATREEKNVPRSLECDTTARFLRTFR